MTPEEVRHRPFSALPAGSRPRPSAPFETPEHRREYGLVADHIESGDSASEAIVREVKEEAGIDIDRSNLGPAHVIHRDFGERVYVDLFFVARRWKVEITNREPEKCADRF